MATVRSLDSAKYGLKLFAYFLVVVVVGGGVLGLGLYLAVPEARTLLGNSTGVTDDSVLAGGAVLSLLGAVVLLSGLFGMFYKLVADAVATGVAEASEHHSAGDKPTAPETAGKVEKSPSQAVNASRDDRDVTSAESSDERAAATTATETTAKEWSQAPSAGTAADQSKGSDETAASESEAPEPSPEEIAFGSREDDERTAEDESRGESADSTDTTPAGSTSSEDPLADPTEDE